jgi:hypothetical protein
MRPTVRKGDWGDWPFTNETQKPSNMVELLLS